MSGVYGHAVPRLLHVVTHPEVQVRPEIPVPEWSLSELGLRRAQGLVRLPWVRQVGHVFSSGEPKAVDTAQMLVQTLGDGTVVVEPDLGENDRSSTGFLPPAEFEELADLFFAHPRQSVRGWEPAACAQARVVRAVERCLRRAVSGDVVVVCHGAVGTLLWCHLAGESIDRRRDQPGQGSWYPVDLDTRRPLAGWQRVPLAPQ